MKNAIQVAQEASAQGAPLSSHVFDLVVDDGKHSTGEGKKRRKGAIRLLTHLLILSIVGFVVLINALSLSLSLSLSNIYPSEHVEHARGDLGLRAPERPLHVRQWSLYFLMHSLSALAF